MTNQRTGRREVSDAQTHSCPNGEVHILASRAKPGRTERFPRTNLWGSKKL